jgi:stalled ribosome rescue protein Dom34
VLVSIDLPMGSSNAEIARAAERDAKILRDARDAAAVEQVLNLAASNGRGVTGAKQTLAVMSTGEGRQLFITPRFLAEHADEAEAAVEFALDHAADIEVLAGDAAARLDAQAGGIASSLRFGSGLAPGGSSVLRQFDGVVTGHLEV